MPLSAPGPQISIQLRLLPLCLVLHTVQSNRPLSCNYATNHSGPRIRKHWNYSLEITSIYNISLLILPWIMIWNITTETADTIEMKQPDISDFDTKNLDLILITIPRLQTFPWILSRCQFWIQFLLIPWIVDISSIFLYQALGPLISFLSSIKHIIFHQNLWILSRHHIWIQCDLIGSWSMLMSKPTRSCHVRVFRWCQGVQVILLEVLLWLQY